MILTSPPSLAMILATASIRRPPSHSNTFHVSCSYWLSLLFCPVQTSNFQRSSQLVIYSYHTVQTAMTSVVMIVHRKSCLIMSVNLSITIANKRGLRAEPYYSLTSILYLCMYPNAHLAPITLPSYIFYASLTFFSATPDFFILIHNSV